MKIIMSDPVHAFHRRWDSDLGLTGSATLCSRILTTKECNLPWGYYFDNTFDNGLPIGILLYCLLLMYYLQNFSTEMLFEYVRKMSSEINYITLFTLF